MRLTLKNCGYHFTEKYSGKAPGGDSMVLMGEGVVESNLWTSLLAAPHISKVPSEGNTHI